jgi:hypothetical protein
MTRGKKDEGVAIVYFRHAFLFLSQALTLLRLSALIRFPLLRRVALSLRSRVLTLPASLFNRLRFC